MTELLHQAEFWQYLSIPVIAALIGWTTNWLNPAPKNTSTS